MNLLESIKKLIQGILSSITGIFNTDNVILSSIVEGNSIALTANDTLKEISAKLTIQIEQNNKIITLLEGQQPAVTGVFAISGPAIPQPTLLHLDTEHF